MVILLVILTVLVIITVELVREKKKPVRKTVPLPVIVTHPSTSIIERYLHPGHCWVRVMHPERVVVGVDDFTQRLAGSFDTVELPTEGTTVYQGQPFLTLRHGGKAIRQVAPVSGIVERVNEKLYNHPSLINRSPYQKGWIAQLIPTNFHIDVNNLLKGSVADRWQEAVRLQLIHWFTVMSGAKLGTVLQDGGQLIDSISDLLNDEEWNRLIDEFYPHVYNRKHIVSNSQRKEFLS